MDSQPTRAHARTTGSRSTAKLTRQAETLRIDPGDRPPPPPGSVVTDSAIRCLDLALAATLMIMLALPMLALGLLIRLTSPGPVLYFQERVGRGGRRFTLIKFRTMRLDAEADTGPVWASPGDSRCTRLGAGLRRLSLDELPQMFNVLRGEMSLVGPRPERPCFVKEFVQELPGYMDRHRVLPGITGWAQINGWRGNTSIAKRLEHDLYYVKHRSLRLNLWILLMTPWRVLVERNAY
jgi:lipopolysaccharide/colanic/teichoic acid biosynthesis glycosyltransferase